VAGPLRTAPLLNPSPHARRGCDRGRSSVTFGQFKAPIPTVRRSTSRP